MSTKGKDTSKDTTQSGVLVIEVHDSGAGVSAENCNSYVAYHYNSNKK